MRVAFVDAHRDRWPVAVICRAIGLSERTYHARKSRPPSARAVRDEALKVDIARVCTVERLMADMGLRGVQRGKKLYTTVADDNAQRPPDLVGRQFVAGRPNELWLADITYCSTWEGWLYVSFIEDVFSRMIVGWQIATHMRTELVLDALEMALFRRDVTGPLTHHSDAGSQFTAIRYSDRLAEAGVAASIGSVGDSYDNAMCEALNGTFKAELVKLHGLWRTRAQLETEIINWIYWYNERRLHGEIGDIPPAEFEQFWYTYNQPAPTGN